MVEFQTEIMQIIDSKIAKDMTKGYAEYSEQKRMLEDYIANCSNRELSGVLAERDMARNALEGIREAAMRHYMNEALCYMFNIELWNECFSDYAKQKDISYIEESRRLANNTYSDIIDQEEVMSNKSYSPLEALEEEYKILLKVASYGDKGIKNFYKNNQNIEILCNDACREIINIFTGLLKLEEEDRNIAIESLATKEDAYKDVDSEELISMYTDEPEKLLAYHKKQENQKKITYPINK